MWDAKLTDLLYDANLPPWKVAQACLDWGCRYPVAPTSRMPRRRGRLRIGYLSGNFCVNPEVFFTLPILRHHDHTRFEVFCYSNVLQPDAYTRRFQKLAQHWRDISRLSDPGAAARIKADGIDILVDLSGHWASGRLPLFALRPAPVQISFPTYPCTTGLPAMDFRITDALADPPGASEHLHSEQLIRLNRCFCCYELPRPLPEVGTLPAIARGYITFGCFHRPQKLSFELLRLWAAILKRVPKARLLFHHVFSGTRAVGKVYREPILAGLARSGIASHRVRFAGARPHPEHLATIADADIALDAFPYHGMTMTCDSLAMGVPVVTFAGRSHVSRVGVSLLTAAGLPDWVAPSAEEYIEIAVARAGDLQSLARLRANLRRRLRSSPLTAARAYVDSLEHAYLQCLSMRPPGHATAR